MNRNHTMIPSATRRWQRFASLAALALLTGCAALDPDAGFQAVERIAQQRLGKDLQWARSPADQPALQARVDQLLSQSLTADAAVQIALLNNRGLQARLAELGIGDADRVQASRLQNPGISLARLRRGDEVELERGLHFGLASLIALPWQRELADKRFAQAQREVTMAMLLLAAESRKAYFQALAAEQTLGYRRQVLQAADASAELARRMQQVGNFSKLQQAREQAFYADAALGLLQAEQAVRSSRERLIRQLGLWGAQTGFKLPSRLPDLPASPINQPDIEREALTQRLDVMAAKQAAEQTAAQLGLTRRTRFINVLELGASDSRSNEAPTQRGWEISLELPLFDWGEARVVRAEALYMQRLHQAAEVAINARSQVREAYGAYRTAWDAAQHHRAELVPLRQLIAEQNLLRYNGMLIGVFELLADARLQIGSVINSIDALRDFWIAQADLDQAMVGPPALAATAASTDSAGPAAGGAGH